MADLLVVAFAIMMVLYQFPRTLPGELLDFGSLVASGQAARQGLNPYGVYPLTFHFKHDGFDIWNPNLNPPISALFLQAFSLVEPRLAFRIWYEITVILYAGIIFLLLRRFRDIPRLPFIVCAAALAGFWETLILGQIYVPMVLACVGGWLLLERRSDVWAGVLIGIVVALKPNFAVWPVLLLLSQRFKPALVSVAVAAFISALPAVVLGPEVYRQWFALIASDASRAMFPTNAALSGLAARIGVAMIGTALSVLLLGGAALWALTQRRTVQEVSAVALIVSLLASPIAWIHYTLFLLPVICWLWQARGMRLFVALLIVPVPLLVDQIPRGKLLLLSVGSIYNWALIFLLGILIAADVKKLAMPNFSRVSNRSSAAPAN